MKPTTCLLLVTLFFGGLAWRGDHIWLLSQRSGDDTEVLHAMMNVGGEEVELLPPPVLGSR